ncbi:MAG: hypothetical protein KDI52_11740 [Xanthomonadales bacterium]|nr:hypothetical protein [Xanthomonadales bacterium]
MNILNKKPKFIQIEINKLVCHPSILKIKEFDSTTKNQINQISIPDYIQSLASMNTIPMVIKTDETYHYISGWEVLKEKNKNKKVYVLLIMDELSNEEILNIAWCYVLSKQINSWHHESSLMNLVNLLNIAPSDIYESIQNHLNQNQQTKAKSSSKIVEYLTRSTRGKIRGQINEASSSAKITSKHFTWI